MPTMPFGKYRDRDLRRVPTGYLVWAVESIDLRPWLHDAICAELDRREFADEDDDDPPPSGHQGTHPRDGPDLRALIARWHRQLCLRHHPDRGGHPAAMAALNDARDELLDLLRREGAIR